MDLATGKPMVSKLPDWTRVNLIEHNKLVGLMDEISQLKSQISLLKLKS